MERHIYHKKNVVKYEVVKKFVYLQSMLITKNGSGSKEIKRRVANARSATIKRRKLRVHITYILHIYSYNFLCNSI